MRHVWILNHYAVEPNGAGGTRHYNLAKHLPAHGWTVSIIASSVELNSGRQRLNKDEKFRLEIFGEVPFLWVRTPRYRGNGGGRVLNMLTYAVRALFPSVTKCLTKPDVIIGSTVHPFAAITGALLAQRQRVPFIFEVRDLWPQTLIDMKRIKEHGFTAYTMRSMERWLCHRASRIVMLLPRAEDYIVRLGVPAKKATWISNGVELSDFPYRMPAVTPEQTFTLMYFGAHGQANGLDNILHAIKLVNDVSSQNKIRLRLIGDGPQKATLQNTARRLQLSNVVFEPSMPKSKIPLLAEQADAFVFNLVDIPVFRYGISSNKLYDFMAAARPIIFCCDAGNNPVKDADCGITINSGSPQALAEGIMEMANLPLAERIAMGMRGRRHVEMNYSYEKLAQRFAATLDEAIMAGGK